jgi:hypothetical protein
MMPGAWWLILGVSLPALVAGFLLLASILS